jgi:hypothetical protein
VKREPVSELRREIVLDLCDDDDVIVIESLKRRIFQDVE